MRIPDQATSVTRMTGVECGEAKPPRDVLELMLREVTHRCANDLQMVTSLLKMQSRKSDSAAVRQALDEAADRVSILAQARDLARRKEPTLEAALQHVCAALNSQADVHSILLSLEFATNVDGLSDEQITCVALCVNELATNAIKHAFQDGETGRIEVRVEAAGKTELTILVSDNGAPLNSDDGARPGMGLDLVRALIRSVNGTFHEPSDRSKTFKIVIDPATPSAGAEEP